MEIHCRVMKFHCRSLFRAPVQVNLIHGSRFPSMRMRLVEETEAHVLIRLLVVLSGSGGSGGVTTGGGGGGSDRSSRGVSIGVSDAVLELINLGPAVVGLDGDSEDLLVAVDELVDNGRDGGVADSQGDGGDGGHGLGEGSKELLLGDVEDIGTEDLTLLVDLGDGHTVGEGRDVQQVQQGSLGGTDLVAGLNELEVGDNFNGTTGNLGGDTESLEEGGLTGLHTSVTTGDPDIIGSDGTGLGGSGDTVGEDLLLDVLEVTVGEDETDVALDERLELLELRVLGDEALEGTANHGVLTHQHGSLATEGDTDLVHLLGRDIVNSNNEDGRVSVKLGPS